MTQPEPVQPERAEQAPQSQPEPDPAHSRRGARLRLITVATVLLLHGLTLFAWSGTWVTATVEGAALLVGGDVAAPAVPALALSGLALAGALTLAGPVFRAILGVLQVLLGASIALSAMLALSAPAAAAAPTVTARTGIAGERSVSELLEGVAVTALPVLTLALGLASAAVGVLLLVTLRRWPTRSRRFSAVRLETQPERGSIGEWDALSDGADPTAERHDPAPRRDRERGTAG